MKISILLPYKENFSPDYPGAVSIYVKDTILCSKYKNKIVVFGSTNYKKKLLNNYVNLPFNKEIFQYIPPKKKSSLEQDIFPSLIKKGVSGFQTNQPLFDIGTPERLNFAKANLLKFI